MLKSNRFPSLGLVLILLVFPTAGAWRTVIAGEGDEEVVLRVTAPAKAVAGIKRAVTAAGGTVDAGPIEKPPSPSCGLRAFWQAAMETCARLDSTSSRVLYIQGCGRSLRITVHGASEASLSKDLVTAKLCPPAALDAGLRPCFEGLGLVRAATEGAEIDVVFRMPRPVVPGSGSGPMDRRSVNQRVQWAAMAVNLPGTDAALRRWGTTEGLQAGDVRRARAEVAGVAIKQLFFFIHNIEMRGDARLHMGAFAWSATDYKDSDKAPLGVATVQLLWKSSQAEASPASGR